ncbi:MAG: transposase [Alphaproteobacteria bacterium]|nr:transposase [Alphaproteobacteria bacterium]
MDSETSEPKVESRKVEGIQPRKIRYRIRDITHQICAQLGVKIIKGALSNNHVHVFVEIPSKISGLKNKGLSASCKDSSGSSLFEPPYAPLVRLCERTGP